VFTPAMIRQHFRVVDMGNLLPGQNFKLAPPYVISFALAGESAPARIDQSTRTITVYRRPASPAGATARWTLFPQDARAEHGTRTLVSGATEIDFARITTLRLITPNGATDDWRILTALP
jgi:hypothetical protein